MRPRYLHYVWILVAASIVLTLPAKLHTQQVRKAAAVTPPSLQEITVRMEEARKGSKPTDAFQIMREYWLFHGDNALPESDVKAEINVIPPRDLDYTIVESKGSDRGEKVVKKILDHETRGWKEEVADSAIAPDNYNFGFLGMEMIGSQPCYVLQLLPKRKDPSLVEGKAWVDTRTFRVLKIEGQMAKSPSWFVRKVNVTVTFGEMGGIWTQTASDAVADVRFVGQYKVAGRVLSVQPAMAQAANQKPERGSLRTGRRQVPAEILYGPVVSR